MAETAYPRQWKRPPILIKDPRWRYGIYIGALVYLVLAGASVVIAAVSSYLIINKLWSRRTMRDVAESISISTR